eukprot:13162458-Alexandrium_andersonii.AAC.1
MSSSRPHLSMFMYVSGSWVVFAVFGSAAFRARRFESSVGSRCDSRWHAGFDARVTWNAGRGVLA